MINKTLTNTDFIGKGLGFPPEFIKNQSEQDIVMVEGAQDIEQSLQILLSTRPNERMLAPDYGCNLDPLIFEPLDLSLISLMQDVVKMAIIRYEPRIKLNQVQIETQDSLQGTVAIHIDYTIKSTNSRFNFVYPFYLQEGTDINQ